MLRLGDEVRVNLVQVKGIGVVTGLDVMGITDDPMVRVKVGSYPHAVHVRYPEVSRV